MLTVVKMRRIPDAGLTILLCFSFINCFAQERIENDFPFVSIGVGRTFLPLSSPGSDFLMAERVSVTAIPISFGGYINRHFFQVIYYFDRFIPTIKHHYPLAQNNSPQKLNFSIIFMEEETFGFLYGYGFPFTISGKKFAIYPKAGLHALYISRNSVGSPTPSQSFRHPGGQEDILLIDQLSFKKEPEEYFFLTAGVELEMTVNHNIRLYWQTIYNYGISDNVYIFYKYRLYKDELAKEGVFPVDINNFHLSAGLRFPITRNVSEFR